MTSNNPSRRSDALNFRVDLETRLNDPDFAKEFAIAREKASLGLKIAKLRASRGLSQTELAAKINTTQSVISRYESADYVNYRLETLRRLATALGGELKVDIEVSE
jgi:ribosome-binding protein aMBF1 (putative translation factor)